MSEAVALAVLVASLAAAVARPRRVPDWLLAGGGAVLLVITGVSGWASVRAELRELGPTVAFLAALLALAEGCRRAGLFEAIGAAMAHGARGSGKRLLATVFLAAAATTAVLSLDATVVLLTPVVLVTAGRLRIDPRPASYACAHLANSASLLLPVSNLTNLLAFRATGLSFARFAELMVLPWLVALAIEWAVIGRHFRDSVRGDLGPRAAGSPALPRLPLAVLAATLIGFSLSSAIGLAPVWVATAGALILLARDPGRPAQLDRALQPGFLVFVLALGVVVRAAGDHGLSHAIDSVLPTGSGLPALLAVAGLSALFANLVNNLPATLIVLPLVSVAGAGPVLAMLIGVGVGPNLTYVGSLATLLWRRLLHVHGEAVSLRDFSVLGALSVPPILLGSTAALWLALRLS